MGLRPLWIATCVVLFAACGEGDDDDATEGPDAGPDRSDELFAPDHLVEVKLELPAADWDALRRQTRSIVDVLGGDCLAAPFESPFTYFEATATIDGERFERVGLRKKGFLGSLSETRPSLKIKLDEYVAGQAVLSMDKLTFNNAQQDPALIRQCLAYDLFRAAGVEAARCNFAHLEVNGDDLGVFVHVEAADKDFIERRFADASGNLYEGTLSDFRPEFTGTFDLKTNEAEADRTDLEQMVAALEAPDDELVAALEPHLDLERFLTFWAMEVLTSHWDGYASNTNNFYLYDDPATGRFVFMPWGVDGTFQSNPLIDEAPPESVFASGALARRLYLLPDTRARYLARLRELLDEVWSEAALRVEIDRMEQLIGPAADPDGTLGLAGRLDELRLVTDGRRAVIEDELADGPPVWTQELRAPLCLATIGEIDATFATTWATLDDPDPFATGDGTLDFTVNGVTPVTGMVGAKAGPDPDLSEGPRAQVQIVATLDDGTIAVVVARVSTGSFAPATLEIDWGTVFGALYRYDPETDTASLIGILGSGTLELDAASMAAGEPVTGTMTAELVEWPF
jgi:hypothetical protein